MANFRYFNGETELRGPHGMDNRKFAEKFGAAKSRKFDSYARLVAFVPGTNDVIPVERAIQYKSNPSKHVCDARCLNATGKVMKCECSCGGKNHGRGSFVCE